jgi:carbonic anhydrase/acetyltransferase-like protein (isoleucine patch superfamily)
MERLIFHDIIGAMKRPVLYALGEDRVELRGSHHFVAPDATLIGRVVLEHEASVWFKTVIRGDNDPIVIGAGSNIQDGSVLHTDDGIPLTVGPAVTVGHQVMLHGCAIGEGSLIGIKAVVLNHAAIGRECLIGACALIPEGRVIPDRSLVMGTPGKVVRQLTDAEVAGIRAISAGYVANARRYLAHFAADPR